MQTTNHCHKQNVSFSGIMKTLSYYKQTVFISGIMVFEYLYPMLNFTDETIQKIVGIFETNAIEIRQSSDDNLTSISIYFNSIEIRQSSHDVTGLFKTLLSTKSRLHKSQVIFHTQLYIIGLGLEITIKNPDEVTHSRQIIFHTKLDH